LWRAAKACHSISNTIDSKDSRKKEWIFKGVEFVTEAVNITDANFDVLKWAAILIGESTDFLSSSGKIKQGQLFKEYLDKAIALKPMEYTLLHMRGRYFYSIANLSWLERKLVNTLCPSITATIDDALNDFLKVNVLIDNLLFLARCLISKNDKKRAMMYLTRASHLTPKNEAENQVLKEVNDLLTRYKLNC
uniref:TPR_REGION domain-containing protein n=1 Tax=Dracunculus medinensis TaxID=318479 RepID=A0A0N4UCH6_DRAME